MGQIAEGKPPPQFVSRRIDRFALSDCSFVGHTQEVLSIAFSTDGSRMFSADYSGAIWVWNVASFVELLQLRGHGAHVRRIIFTEYGPSLISASGDSTKRVWSAGEIEAAQASTGSQTSRR